MRIRVTKEFRFELAHMLPDHKGACRNVHGHSYHMMVTLIGAPVSASGRSDSGMVIDFGDLKEIVNKEIISRYDHSMLLPVIVKDKISAPGRVLWVDWIPTCENLLIDCVGRIKDKLPNNVELISVSLRETSTSFAEWRKEDN